MRFAKRPAVALVLALAAGGALAGEDSTDRYYGFGPAYWQTDCGLACYSPAAPQFPAAAEQPY